VSEFKPRYLANCRLEGLYNSFLCPGEYTLASRLSFNVNIVQKKLFPAGCIILSTSRDSHYDVQKIPFTAQHVSAIAIRQSPADELKPNWRRINACMTLHRYPAQQPRVCETAEDSAIHARPRPSGPPTKICRLLNKSNSPVN